MGDVIKFDCALANLAQSIMDRAETVDARYYDELLFFKVLYKFNEVLDFEKRSKRKSKKQTSLKTQQNQF